MHHTGWFDGVFIVMWVCCFLIRMPAEFRSSRTETVESRRGAQARFYLMLVFTGSTTLPLLYFFTPWFDFADYEVGPVLGSLGSLLALSGVLLFWRSHRDLGRQFSVMLEVKASHEFISRGVYKNIRHPMYTAAFAVSTAQLLLIGNFVVAPAFLLTFTLLYCTRIHHEEQMMLDRFGSAYADYQRRTNRLFPSLRR